MKACAPRGVSAGRSRSFASPSALCAQPACLCCSAGTRCSSSRRWVCRWRRDQAPLSALSWAALAAVGRWWGAGAARPGAGEPGVQSAGLASEGRREAVQAGPRPVFRSAAVVCPLLLLRLDPTLLLGLSRHLCYKPSPTRTEARVVSARACLPAPAVGLAAVCLPSIPAPSCALNRAAHFSDFFQNTQVFFPTSLVHRLKPACAAVGHLRGRLTPRLTPRASWFPYSPDSVFNPSSFCLEDICTFQAVLLGPGILVVWEGGPSAPLCKQGSKCTCRVNLGFLP